MTGVQTCALPIFFEIICGHYRSTSVKEFTRRIDVVVPFLTLSDPEQFALIEHLEAVRASTFFDPPSGEQKWGDVEIEFTHEYTARVKGEYDRFAGASSFLRVLDESMDEAMEKDRRSKVKPKKVWAAVRDEEFIITQIDPTCKGKFLGDDGAAAAPSTSS